MLIRVGLCRNRVRLVLICVDSCWTRVDSFWFVSDLCWLVLTCVDLCWYLCIRNTWSWVVHITRDFIICYSCSYYRFMIIIGVFKNFAKFTRIKYLSESLFFNKVAGQRPNFIKKVTPKQLFYCTWKPAKFPIICNISDRFFQAKVERQTNWMWQ